MPYCYDGESYNQHCGAACTCILAVYKIVAKYLFAHFAQPAFVVVDCRDSQCGFSVNLCV